MDDVIYVSNFIVHCTWVPFCITCAYHLCISLVNMMCGSVSYSASVGGRISIWAKPQRTARGITNPSGVEMHCCPLLHLGLSSTCKPKHSSWLTECMVSPVPMYACILVHDCYSRSFSSLDETCNCTNGYISYSGVIDAHHISFCTTSTN